MLDLINVQKKLFPDVLKILQKRYQILRSIYFSEPIGRRSLAITLGISERVLRSEAEFLKAQGLIEIASSGMRVTEEGLAVFHELEGVMNQLLGLHSMEAQLAEKLNIKGCIIVQGDSDTTSWVLEEMGRIAIKELDLVLFEKQNIIAVMGGTTMAMLAEIIPPHFAKNRDLLFVPGRGGIGEELNNQASTICERIATKTGTRHRMLYVPEQVGKEAYFSLLKEPVIQEGLHLIHSANVVIHGIGNAITMAKRRKTTENILEKIIRLNAVGEAFGYYFNEQGEVVHKVPTLGLQLESLSESSHVIAVAGGASKAKAIKSYMKSAPKNTILITDEGAANSLLKGEKPF